MKTSLGMKLRDALSVVGHWGAPIAALAGLGFAFGPWPLLASAVVAIGGFAEKTVNPGKKERQCFVPYSEEEMRLFGLDEMLKKAMANKPTKEVPLICFWDEEKARKLNLGPRQSEASFISGWPPIIYMNERMVRMFPRNEVFSVLCHELGHMQNGSIHILNVYQSLNLATGLAAAGGAIGVAIDFCVGGAGAVSLAAASLSVAAVDLMGQSLEKSWSRRDEYWADRAVVRFGADPLALIAYLRRSNEWKDKVRLAERAFGVPSLSVREAFAEAKEWINSTHPSRERRYAQLAKIAERQGRPDLEIDEALYSATVLHERQHQTEFYIYRNPVTGGACLLGYAPARPKEGKAKADSQTAGLK